MNRIPLNIVVVESGLATPGVIAAVMVTELDALEAEHEFLRDSFVRMRRVIELDSPFESSEWTLGAVSGIIARALDPSQRPLATPPENGESSPSAETAGV